MSLSHIRRRPAQQRRSSRARAARGSRAAPASSLTGDGNRRSRFAHGAACWPTRSAPAAPRPAPRFYRDALPRPAADARHVLAFLRRGRPSSARSSCAPRSRSSPASGRRSAVDLPRQRPAAQFALAAYCTRLATQPRRTGGVRGPAGSAGSFSASSPGDGSRCSAGSPRRSWRCPLRGRGCARVRQRPAWAACCSGSRSSTSWALVAVPVVFAVMPAPRRRGVIAFLATVGRCWSDHAARMHGVAIGVAPTCGVVDRRHLGPPRCCGGSARVRGSCRSRAR